MKKFTAFLITFFIVITSFYSVANAPELNQAMPEILNNVITEEKNDEISPLKEEIQIEKSEITTESDVTQTEIDIKENTVVNTEDLKTDVPKQNVSEYKTDLSSTKENLNCTLSVKCDTILSNTDKLKKEKLGFVPNDGVIYPEKEVVFYENESVFNVLLREMKQNRIHLEYVKTPAFGSVYIEGINNIYEFDCGDLSGWMYKVNGEFPSYGCSQYTLKDGDRIEFVYTCDLGKDVGEKMQNEKIK